MLGKYKPVQEQCTICSFEKFEKYRSNVLKCQTGIVIHLFYTEIFLQLFCSGIISGIGGMGARNAGEEGSLLSKMENGRENISSSTLFT